MSFFLGHVSQRGAAQRHTGRPRRLYIRVPALKKIKISAIKCEICCAKLYFLFKAKHIDSHESRPCNMRGSIWWQVIHLTLPMSSRMILICFYPIYHQSSANRVISTFTASPASWSSPISSNNSRSWRRNGRRPESYCWCRRRSQLASKSRAASSVTCQYTAKKWHFKRCARVNTIPRAIGTFCSTQTCINHIQAQVNRAKVTKNYFVCVSLTHHPLLQMNFEVGAPLHIVFSLT